VQRESDGGIETVEISLPAVISADLRLVPEVRYVGLPGIMKAKKKPVADKPLADLGVDLSPKVKLLKLEEPKGRSGSCTFVKSVDELVDKLKNQAKVI